VTYFVYLLASRRHGTLYLGVTNDLSRRVWQHKQKAVPGFTGRYGVDRLVWYESLRAHLRGDHAREGHQNGGGTGKINLIQEMNPEWDDLCLSLNR